MPRQETLPIHRSRAVSTHAVSANAVHDDDAARAIGYRRALASGAVIYEHLCRPAVLKWGSDWFSRGTVMAELRGPLYAGESLVVRSGPVETTRDGAEAEVSCYAGVDRLVAVATLGLANEVPTPGEKRYVEVPLAARAHRPIAGPVAFAALDQLGSIERDTSAEAVADFQRSLGLDPTTMLDLHVASPGEIIFDANRLLDANVELGPWLHTATDATHFNPLRPGERSSVRGSVVDVYERHHHHFAVLDLCVFGDDRPVMHLNHTVAWRLGANIGSRSDVRV